MGREPSTSYRITAAARLTGLSTARIRRYIASGLVPVAADERGAPLIGESGLARLRKIRRLSTDLGLNTAGVEIVLRLVDELAALRADQRRKSP
jgi:MerR family transcriptional regulator/heat shock protein HspR